MYQTPYSFLLLAQALEMLFARKTLLYESAAKTYTSESREQKRQERVKWSPR
jgi:hypothetical protein